MAYAQARDVDASRVLRLGLRARLRAAREARMASEHSRRRLAGQLEHAIARAERRYTPFSAAIPVCHAAAAGERAQASCSTSPSACARRARSTPTACALARELLVDGMRAALRARRARRPPCRGAASAAGPGRPWCRQIEQRGERVGERPRRGAATTRSTSAWPRGSARPTACCWRATPSRRPGATSSSGCSRPTGARRPQALAEGLPVVAAAARDLPRHRPRATWTSPPSCARRPELALVDELAHTNAPGLEHDKRYEDIEDLLDAGHRRPLDGQRPAPRVAQRPGGRAERRARARDGPGLGARPRRRGRAHRPQPGGAARPPAGRQGLQARAHRRRAQRLLPHREPRRAARGRAAPGRRGGRGQAPGRPRSSARARTRSRPTSPQAVGERLLALVEPYPGSQRLVRRAWRSAQRLGAAARPAVGGAAGPRARPRAPAPAAGAAASSPRCSAPT